MSLGARTTHVATPRPQRRNTPAKKLHSFLQHHHASSVQRRRHHIKAQSPPASLPAGLRLRKKTKLTCRDRRGLPCRTAQVRYHRSCDRHGCPGRALDGEASEAAAGATAPVNERKGNDRGKNGLHGLSPKCLFCFKRGLLPRDHEIGSIGLSGRCARERVINSDQIGRCEKRGRPVWGKGALS